MERYTRQAELFIQFPYLRYENRVAEFARLRLDGESVLSAKTRIWIGCLTVLPFHLLMKDGGLVCVGRVGGGNHVIDSSYGVTLKNFEYDFQDYQMDFWLDHLVQTLKRLERSGIPVRRGKAVWWT